MDRNDLDEVTSKARMPRPVPWYRSPIDPAVFKELHERSDAKGFLYSVSYLGILVVTGSAVMIAAAHGWIAATVGLLFVHGTCAAFLINAVHEVGHGTVFRTQGLNRFFLRVFSVLAWHNYPIFQASHARHHRYTLHPPDDLEVVLPMRILVKQILRIGFFDPVGEWDLIKRTIATARGRFEGEWMETLFPNAESRREPIAWARVLLAVHGLIIVGALALKLWLLPVVVCLVPCYGRCLQYLCNETQHSGLQDNVEDFRLCTRTFIPNPLLRFLYWQMNYHIEHHMYAAVPCYNLGRLHRLIEHDLPPCPRGLLTTWREIFRIQKLQEADPGYRYMAPLPPSRPMMGAIGVG